jgi:hypothetical protein
MFHWTFAGIGKHGKILGCEKLLGQVIDYELPKIDSPWNQLLGKVTIFFERTSRT